MKIIKISLVSVAVLLAFVSMVHAEASLWLFPQNGGSYVDQNNDPWLHESYVVGPEDFTLEIYNHGRGKGDNSAEDVVLIVAVKDPDSFDSAVVNGIPLDPLIYGSPVFSSGKEIAPHGVFPTWYAEVPIRDIPEDGTLAIPIYIQGDEDLMVHFDAYGVGTASGKGKNKGSEISYDVHNPYSHDLTVVGGINEPPQCDFDITIESSTGSALIGQTIIFTLTAATDTVGGPDAEVDITIPTDENGNLLFSNLLLERISILPPAGDVVRLSITPGIPVVLAATIDPYWQTYGNLPGYHTLTACDAESVASCCSEVTFFVDFLQ
jgi:hypothetical protein